MTCRKLVDDVKTGGGLYSGISPRESLADCSGGVRHEGGVSVVQALMRNVGTCCPDVKGEIQVASHTRMRVPRRGRGAGQPVVAMKSMKVDGAKGLRHPALFVGQPVGMSL